MIYREGEQALDSPELETHSPTWKLGYVDPHDETVPLSRLLDMVRLGDEKPRFFCVLASSLPFLEEYMPAEDYQLLTDAVVVTASNSRLCKTT